MYAVRMLMLRESVLLLLLLLVYFMTLAVCPHV
jgi:hypothetical protein